jgi:hypothetical protein
MPRMRFVPVTSSWMFIFQRQDDVPPPNCIHTRSVWPLPASARLTVPWGLVEPFAVPAHTTTITTTRMQSTCLMVASVVAMLTTRLKAGYPQLLYHAGCQLWAHDISYVCSWRCHRSFSTSMHMQLANSDEGSVSSHPALSAVHTHPGVQLWADP